MTETDLNSIGLAVISALSDCASLIVERDGKFGEMYKTIALQAVNTEGAAWQALFEQANRFAVKAAKAFKLIEIDKIASTSQTSSRMPLSGT